MADNEQPERREPNHLEPRSAAPPPMPVDPEQQKQFEQYQQFQQFLKFQEAQGGALVPAGPPPKKPPLWKQILFSKGFRKLVLVVVVIIGVIWAYNYYFGPPPDDGLGAKGTAGPGQKTDPNRASGSPNEAIDAVYRLIAGGFSQEACFLFDDQGKAAFAGDYNAATCEAAVTALRGKVAALTLPPRVNTTDRPPPIEVSSCTLSVRKGTESLGRFTLTSIGKEWFISGHSKEECSASSSSPSTPTR